MLQAPQISLHVAQQPRQLPSSIRETSQGPCVGQLHSEAEASRPVLDNDCADEEEEVMLALPSDWCHER